MASPMGRGAQVRLDGDAQAAARGAAGAQYLDNLEVKRRLEEAGETADGYAPDGSTATGLTAQDEALISAGGGLDQTLGRIVRVTTPTIEAFDGRIRGDGVTDDSAAFKAAHDAAYAAGVREVYCAGQYYIPTAHAIGNMLLSGPGALIGHDTKRVIPLSAPAAGGPLRSGVIPALHLPKLAATSAPVVVIVGDSTTTLSANMATPLDGLYGRLLRRLREDNPAKTFTFHNRAISGTTWGVFASAGTTDPNPSGHPGWTFSSGTSWLGQVLALQADLIVFNFGVNDSTGLEATSINTALTALCGGAKIPDILFCTNPSCALSFSDAAGQLGRWKAASLQRTIALHGAAALTVANAPPIGLIDIGRQFWRVSRGIDPVEQQLAVSTDLTGTVVTTFPCTLPQSDGDLYLDLTFVGQSATILATGGVSVALDNNTRGLLVIDNGAGGQARCRFLLQNGGGTKTSTGGTTVAIPGSGDLRLQIVLKSNHLWVQMNGSVVLFDAPIYRFASPYAPRITMGSQTAPSMTINRCAVGQATLCQATLTDAEVWGAVADGTWMGNGTNHMSTQGLSAVVDPVLAATNFSAVG